MAGHFASTGRRTLVGGTQSARPHAEVVWRAGICGSRSCSAPATRPLTRHFYVGISRPEKLHVQWAETEGRGQHSTGVRPHRPQSAPAVTFQ